MGKTWGLLLVASLIGAVSSAVAQGYPPLVFEGHFTKATSKGDPLCETIFLQKDYTSKVFLVGPTGRTAVVYFDSPSKTGLFHQLSLVGRLGYDGFQVTKKFEENGKFYSIVAQGILASDLILMEAHVEIRDSAGAPDPICYAESEYDGFNY